MTVADLAIIAGLVFAWGTTWGRRESYRRASALPIGPERQDLWP